MDETTNRRGFLHLVIKGSALLIGALTLVPGVGMLFKPVLAHVERRKAKVIFRNPDDANSTTFVAARYEGQEETAPGIYVRRNSDGTPYVVSAQCTHAACSVEWKATEKQFHCPCHNGLFDQDGKNIGGPPPRPLDRLQAQIVDGEVVVEAPEA